VIARPKVTTKLLRRPPFGFIHAVISEIVRATGFASGLFPENELWREENEEGE
jgi:TRAF3-interacting protein 1